MIQITLQSTTGANVMLCNWMMFSGQSPSTFVASPDFFVFTTFLWIIWLFLVIVRILSSQEYHMRYNKIKDFNGNALVKLNNNDKSQMDQLLH